MQPNSKESNIPALTGIRFVAATMVFLCHNAYYSNEHTGFQGFFRGLLNEMYTGVTVFFVLSGFLICYNYYDLLKSSGRDYRIFFIKRFARTYPLYFILTTLYFVYRFSIGKQELTEFLLNITLLKGFFKDYLYTGILQGWSLTTEETFYLLSPFIFYLIRRNFFLVSIFLMYLVGIVLVTIFSKVSLRGFFADFRFMFWITFFGRCFEFFAGIRLALLVKKKWEKSGQRIAKGKGWCTVIGLMFILFCLAILHLNTAYYHLERGSGNTFGIIINTLILPIGVSVFFFGLITEQTVLKSALSSAPIQILGKSSYAFYLIHLGLLSAFVKNRITTNILLLYLIVLVASMMLFYLIEDPLNRLIKRYFLNLG